MDHQLQLEKSKYRNWVRGGLAYKYFKEGVEEFTDEVVIQEHNRILQKVNHTSGLVCDQCSLRNLRPLHKSETDSNTGKIVCPRRVVNCNCLFKNKRPCKIKVCDAIFEEILETHDSTPPAPYWKNTDIQKWCSTPWEIAKCFINAPGYADKTTASDIDASGLLHIFINNINIQNNLACKINGTDVFNRVLKRRNKIFHSSTMELEENELNALIDDVVEILKDEIALKENPDAKQAVQKLIQLKTDNFVITTHDEVEVCRAAMATIAKNSEELRQQIEDTKTFIESTQSQLKQTADEAKGNIDVTRTEVLESIDDKAEQAKKDLEKQTGIQLESMKQTISLLKEEVKELKLDNTAIKQRLTEVEDGVRRLDEVRNSHHKQLEYVEQKQACQRRFVQLYQEHYVKTWISPLQVQDNDININEVYVKPSMTVEVKEKKVKPIERNAESRKERALTRHKDIFQTDGLLHKKIYILGDVGTGKSSAAKMMIDNWCKAKAEKSEDNTDLITTNVGFERNSDDVEDINEMGRFNFLFFIPLQRMSGLTSDIAEMIKMYYKDAVPSQVLERVLEEESDRCLIIIDGLDEWSPPKRSCHPQHVSFGIPLADGIQNATVITFSRPSAKGILNMKSTEFDQNIKLHGIDAKVVNEFITKYLTKQKGHRQFLGDFLTELKEKRLEHLEKTPLLLQQLIYMYCMGHEIGSTISSIYSNIVNIMLGWTNSKEILGDNADNVIRNPEFFKQIDLPWLLKRFPRCRENKRCLFLLGKIAFEAFIGEINLGTFSCSSLLESGLTRFDIITLTNFGILVENKCIDATYEKTYFSFIHMSYLEFFAALYMASTKNCTFFLRELFKKYKRAADILQLSNLLKMMCGLSPFLVGELSKLISDNVTNDETMIQYRISLYEHSHQANTLVQQIHELTFSCFFESGTNDTHVVNLCDFLIGNDLFSNQFEMSPLKIVNPDSVLSLNISLQGREHESNSLLKWIDRLPRLQFIFVHNSFGTVVSHFLCSQLALSVQQAVSLKHLAVKDIECIAKDCTGYTIDIARHTLLQEIHIENCPFQVGCLGNIVNLETVHLSGSGMSDLTLQGLHCNVSFLSQLRVKTKHETCDKLSLQLTQAESLKYLKLLNIECIRKDCTGHSIDLSRQTQLRSIHLEDCPFRKVSLENTVHLETVHVSGPAIQYMILQHDTFSNLSLSLTQAMSLKQITLKRLECSSQDCTGHTIDLSRHSQLRSIHLEHCEFQVGSLRNTENLVTVYISGSERSYLTTQHEICEDLSTSLTQALSLKCLTLKNIKCNRACCTSHTIDLSKHDRLQSITLSDTNLSVVNVKADLKFEIGSPDILAQLEAIYKTSKLNNLRIYGINLLNNLLYTTEMNFVLQTFERLESLELDFVNVDEAALTVSPTMQNLKNIKMSWVEMSFRTWRTFVDSILALKQSVVIDTKQLMINDNKTAAALEYVRQSNNMFQKAWTVLGFKFFSFKTKSE